MLGLPDVMSTPEHQARERIDALLEQSGWVIQDTAQINVGAGTGVAVREFSVDLKDRFKGYADYLLYVDQKPVGVLEAKRADTSPQNAELQAKDYTNGLAKNIDAPINPLPFCYLSNGAVHLFSNGLDPLPRTRRVFQFHRPETLAEWINADSLAKWTAAWAGDPAAERPLGPGLYGDRPSTLRSRIQALPPVEIPNLWQNKVEAIRKLEESLRADKPRALIQMATGSGKTLLAVTAIYRLIKFGGARRVLFLVDRGNLGVQTETEFEGYRTPDDNRKFTDLYNVQRLTSRTISSSAKVVISTIQRLYSMLQGEEIPDDEAEGEFSLDGAGSLPSGPLDVVYNAAIPPEYFDVIIIDECHRSIYTLWRQVLEYFDAYLIGLTATPAKHTFGFFNGNLVMEYRHEVAVADGVNVDFEVYKIETEITKNGATIKAADDTLLGYRDRLSRKLRWEKPDEDITYGANDLDRSVVAKDQIRLVIKTFKEKLPTEIFPERKEVPKTLIFAKDDSHAEDIVNIVREEFGKGNDFCQKITYKTTGQRTPQQLIQDFRNSYFPRIAVTVDMIATGTDIKPIEIVMFMRTVKSRVLLEQMKGRGVRVIDKTTLQAVTPDAVGKTHFVIVDCVGAMDTPLSDTKPLNTKKSIPLKTLLDNVAKGMVDPDELSTLASRLSRLDKQCGPEEKDKIRRVGNGSTLATISHAIVEALDPDKQEAEARTDNGLGPGDAVTDDQMAAAQKKLLARSVEPLKFNPKLRQTIEEVRKIVEQVIDEITQDELIGAGYSPEATDKAKKLVKDFETFIKENKDEITALQFFYSKPYRERPTYQQIKEIHEKITAPPRSWTEAKLWAAYQRIEQSKVRGANSHRRLTDIVSLVRFALGQEDELVPYADQVRLRYENWLAQQENRGRTFTTEQLQWLEMIRDQIANSIEMDLDDFGYTPFINEGGLGKARQVFGTELGDILDELNRELVA